MGQSPSSDSYNLERKGLPFYQGNADFGDIYPITRTWCSKPIKTSECGDILISVRAPIGAINFSKEKCCIGRGLAALSPDEKKLSSEFLFWYLKRKNKELNKKGTGSTFKAINKKILEEIQIPDIDLKQQQLCAKNLNRIYSIIQKRKYELKKFDDLVQARFVEMFGEPFRNQKKWPLERLIEVAPIKQKCGVFLDELWLLNLDAIEAHTGKVLFKQRIKSNELSSSTIYFTTDNILYSKLRPYLNKVVIPDENGVATSELIPLCPKQGKLNRTYLCFWLRSESFVKNISEKVAGAKMPRVSMDYFRLLDIEVPPIDLQERFAAFVEQTDKSKADKKIINAMPVI